jgi:hypothetical protein
MNALSTGFQGVQSALLQLAIASAQPPRAQPPHAAPARVPHGAARQ